MFRQHLDGNGKNCIFSKRYICPVVAERRFIVANRTFIASKGYEHRSLFTENIT